MFVFVVFILFVFFYAPTLFVNGFARVMAAH